MAIRFHPHARERMEERGALEDEVKATVDHGEQIPAKFERRGFRRNFHFEGKWRGKDCRVKQIEAYAVREGADWLVITVITRYF